MMDEINARVTELNLALVLGGDGARDQRIAIKEIVTGVT